MTRCGETGTGEKPKYSKLKKAGKIAGLTGLTIACPPVGLGVLANISYHKSQTFENHIDIGFLAGVVLSLAINIPNLALSRKIYDSPRLEYSHSVTIESILGAFVSPLSSYFNPDYETNLENENGEYSFRGKVVKFEEGQYHLNVNEDTEFDFNGMTSVNKVRGELEKALEKGDIIKARELEKRLQNVQDAYKTHREAFINAVEIMNSELNGLRR